MSPDVHSDQNVKSESGGLDVWSGISYAGVIGKRGDVGMESDYRLELSLGHVITG